MTFPLYGDSVPAAVVRAVEVIRDDPRDGAGALAPRFAAIVNCGFPSAQECDLALSMCRFFARDAGLQWVGGLAVGMGGALRGRAPETLGGMGRPVVGALVRLAEALVSDTPLPEPDGAAWSRLAIPVWLYLMVGNLQWRIEALKNRSAFRLFDRPFAR